MLLFPHDPTSRVIAATILYVDALLGDVGHVTADFPKSWWNMWDVITVSQGEIQGSVGLLGERKARLEQLLDEYRKYMTHQE